MRFGLSFVILIVTSGPSFADQNTANAFMDGNQLYSVCEIGPTPVCAGYLEGVFDSMAHGDTIYGWRLCTPEGNINYQQIKDIAINYLRNHANIRHYKAVSLIAEAFASAFPCSH
jgi:hypothetical protein